MRSSLERSTGGLKPPPCSLVRRKSKPIALRRRCKASDQNSGAGEMIEQIISVTRFEQTEQIGTAKRFQARFAQKVIQPFSIACQPCSRRGDPCRIAQRQ